MNNIIPVYGEETVFLDDRTGLLFVSHDYSQTAPIHTHNFFEFFLVTSGTAVHLVNNKLQTLQKGSLVFVRAKDVHTYQYYNSDDFHIVNLGFSARIFQNVQSFIGMECNIGGLLEGEITPVVSLGEKDRAQLEFILRSVGDMIPEEDYRFTILCAKKVITQVFCDYFYNYIPSDYNRGQPKWLLDTVHEMEKEENICCGMSKMLEIANCSKAHLSRTFRKYYGITPTEFLNDIRLEHAVKLLLETDREILEISMDSGFQNLSYFYRQFRKKYQITPMEARKMMSKR